MARITREQSRMIFNYPSPPKVIVEQQFDGLDEGLVELAQTPWDQLKDADWWYYLLDMAYVELQPDLFAYLFPGCLDFWYQTLMQSMACARGDSDFHYALLQGQILEKMVTPSQYTQILNFFHDGFLDRLDQERGFIYSGNQISAYGWISRFNSLGYVVPLTESIWNSWWSMETYGQAVCALMYLSGLIYAMGENPIFKAWTPEDGGGGPYLWACDSAIYDRGWLPANLDFFRRTLTVDYFGQKVNEAANRLVDEPEAALAAKIAYDYAELSGDVEIRMAILLERLAEVSPIYRDW